MFLLATHFRCIVFCHSLLPLTSAEDAFAGHSLLLNICIAGHSLLLYSYAAGLIFSHCQIASVLKNDLLLNQLRMWRRICSVQFWIFLDSAV
jgi:hypothetical protein